MIVQFGATVDEETVAGDQVSSRMVRFGSQADQILFLRETVRQSRGLAAIRARARDIVFRLYNCPQRNEVAYAIAIGKWVQANIQYVRELPEVFQMPAATIALGYGDCDDLVTVVCSLLEAVGIESELVGMEWDAPGAGRAFQHIFPRAVVPAGRGRQPHRIPLDTTLQRPIEDLTNPLAIALEQKLRVRLFVA